MAGWRFPDSPLNNKMRCGPLRNARSAVIVAPVFQECLQYFTGYTPKYSCGTEDKSTVNRGVQGVITLLHMWPRIKARVGKLFTLFHKARQIARATSKLVVHEWQIEWSQSFPVLTC